MGESVPADETGLEPLTYAQRPIWIGQQLDPGNPLYNMAFAIVVDAALDRDAFRRAWRHVARRSDALRTTAIATGGAGVARVGRAAPDVELLDAGAIGDDGFLAWCRQRCERPLDTRERLVDTVLASLPDGRTGWYLNQHHLIADAYSTALVHQRVSTAYERIVGGGPADDGGAQKSHGYYPTTSALQASGPDEVVG